MCFQLHHSGRKRGQEDTQQKDFLSETQPTSTSLSTGTACTGAPRADHKQLQATMCVLGFESGSPGRGASTPNCWSISLAAQVFSFLIDLFLDNFIHITYLITITHPLLSLIFIPLHSYQTLSFPNILPFYFQICMCVTHTEKVVCMSMAVGVCTGPRATYQLPL